MSQLSMFAQDTANLSTKNGQLYNANIVQDEVLTSITKQKTYNYCSARQQTVVVAIVLSINSTNSGSSGISILATHY